VFFNVFFNVVLLYRITIKRVHSNKNVEVAIYISSNVMSIDITLG